MQRHLWYKASMARNNFFKKLNFRVIFFPKFLYKWKRTALHMPSFIVDECNQISNNKSLALYLSKFTNSLQISESSLKVTGQCTSASFLRWFHFLEDQLWKLIWISGLETQELLYFSTLVLTIHITYTSINLTQKLCGW